MIRVAISGLAILVLLTESSAASAQEPEELCPDPGTCYDDQVWLGDPQCACVRPEVCPPSCQAPFIAIQIPPDGCTCAFQNACEPQACPAESFWAGFPTCNCVGDPEADGECPEGFERDFWSGGCMPEGVDTCSTYPGFPSNPTCPEGQHYLGAPTCGCVPDAFESGSVWPYLAGCGLFLLVLLRRRRRRRLR